MKKIIRKEIGGIKFGLLSPKIIRNMSAMEIIVPELYDQDGFPVEGGLMDPRLGVVDPGMRCRSCGGKVGSCPGHFGHIELAKPVVHVRFGKQIYNWLSSTCPACGRVKLSEKKRKKYLRRFQIAEMEGTTKDVVRLIKKIIRDARDSETCPFCESPQPEIKFDKPTTYYQDGDKLEPSEVREWLEKLPDEDLQFLGIDVDATRPEWAVLTVMFVPPVTARPSITLETGERSEDDMTHKLVDIMRINSRLKENMASGAPAVIIEDFWELLQYHVTTLIDNQVSGVPPARHRAGRMLKGIVQRIKTKEGRFRRNLAGKRVNFSARTVISPDSQISAGEVGVPYEVGKTLTIPVYVTEDNKEWLQELIRNGPDEVAGANYVIDDERNRLRITDFNSETLAEQLQRGWIVERHLRDGDMALLNRQPTLHRMSIMGHQVKLLPGRTFRINPAVCPPYNADFDGDEMNLHLPQGEEARSEARYLLGIPYNLRSPRFGGIIVGAWTTHLSGIFLLTRDGTELTRDDAFQLLYAAGMDPEDLSIPGGKKKFTGKEVFSLLIPDDLSMSFPNKAGKTGKLSDEESEVVVEKGKLVAGVIDEGAVGSFTGKLMDRIVQDYGPDFAKDFVDHVTRLSLKYLSMRQMSIGVNDLQTEKEVRRKIKRRVRYAEKKVQEMIEKFEEGKLEPWPGLSVEETLESDIINRLNKVRDQAVEMVSESADVLNPAVVMAISGARGKLLNLGLISGIVGQQAIGGSRPQRGYYNDRTFPHFHIGDLGTESRGFVSNAYGTGLDPFEFFWVSAAGREGLADTGVKTPKSGYMYRRLSNALHDLKVEHDGTVRDDSGTIIQFKYGEDGIDVTRSDFGTIDMDKIAEEISDAS